MMKNQDYQNVNCELLRYSKIICLSLFRRFCKKAWIETVIFAVFVSSFHAPSQGAWI